MNRHASSSPLPVARTSHDSHPPRGDLPADLPQRLTRRLALPLPSPRAYRAYEPELSYGRHYSPAPADARPAAVVACIYPGADGWMLPLMLRPRTMADHAGQVSFPGGVIEPGETSEQAALREMEEELGVPAKRVTLLGRLTPLNLFVSHFQVQPWLAVAAERLVFQPDQREVAELLEVPLAHLLDPRNTGRHVLKKRGLHFQTPYFAWGEHRIWGATCMMLGEVLALVREVCATDDP